MGHWFSSSWVHSVKKNWNASTLLRPAIHPTVALTSAWHSGRLARPMPPVLLAHRLVVFAGGELPVGFGLGTINSNLVLNVQLNGDM